MPWLALACLVGLLLAYGVLANFTGEPRAALWGETGTVTGVSCRTYDNTMVNAGVTTGCSGTFTPDGGGSSFDVRVGGDVRSQPVRARLVDGSPATAYVSPTLWSGVLPVGIALLVAGVPAAATVEYARFVRARRARSIPPARPAPSADDPGLSDF
ncbi:hypothetical protein GCM10023235_78000 [Kitasatospora terrestris]|uniref:DUF3592 domain-containing protein n=1 Tax=Kitasatospora terrestris TaxID=258051 RepID=A0ABP9ER35_9ACTN